jgi:glutamate racemase
VSPRANARANPAVGVFDSGVGGLSVLREIHGLLPDIPTLYYADQAHVPYGPRNPEEIHSFVEASVRFLIERGAAMVVLACHVASATSLHPLRACFPQIPFVGMEPAVKPAAEATHSGVIGVLTTQATADGALYRRVVAEYAAHVRVITQIVPELVIMVERQTQDAPESQAILRDYVEPLVAAGADQIVLACTHFPFLKDVLRRITDVPLVDPSAAVARQVRRVLPPNIRPVKDEHCYFTSGSPEQFRVTLKHLIGVEAEVGKGL